MFSFNDFLFFVGKQTRVFGGNQTHNLQTDRLPHYQLAFRNNTFFIKIYNNFFIDFNLFFILKPKKLFV